MNHRIPDAHLNQKEQISLCEALDRILNKGVVIVGEITISVANVDLVYLGLQAMLSSVETARQGSLEDDIPESLLQFRPKTGVTGDESIGTD